MPLLYGEGRTAFIRLQGKIIKILDDVTRELVALPASKEPQMYGTPNVGGTGGEHQI